jgi:hypothetical protein
MANVLAPFGFSESHKLTGAPNYQFSRKRISSANTTQIFKGDPVTQLSTGYITQSAAGTTQIDGIFFGCEYQSISQKKPIWSAYWPGTDANGDVIAYVIDDPATVFRVQANALLAFTAVGNNANFALSTVGGNGTAGNGNTLSGQSTAVLDVSTVNTTSTLPFRIVELIYDPPGSNGTDTTSAYNWAYVAFNFQSFKSTTGI